MTETAMEAAFRRAQEQAAQRQKEMEKVFEKEQLK